MIDEYKETNDLLRGMFRQKYPDITKIKQSDIHRLLAFLDEELEQHFEDGNLKMYMIPMDFFTARMILDKSIAYKGLDLKVAAHYFERGRQGITFTRDGNVYFCGWAGGNNYKPFQRGFKRWLEYKGQNK